jgi:AcrR family transcriptional regulator
MARTPRRPRLTPDDWIAAALQALAEGGVPAVAVDRLARALGATRGSFYWHFKDRRELVERVLERWERENTTELIPPAEAIADPAERLRHLFREVYETPADPVEVALAWAVDEPLVAAAVARVTQARLDFLRRIFVELDLPGDDVEARAWLAYGFYVGHHQLGRNPELADNRPRSLDAVVDLLTRPAGYT